MKKLLKIIAIILLISSPIIAETIEIKGEEQKTVNFDIGISYNNILSSYLLNQEETVNDNIGYFFHILDLMNTGLTFTTRFRINSFFSLGLHTGFNLFIINTVRVVIGTSDSLFSMVPLEAVFRVDFPNSDFFIEPHLGCLFAIDVWFKEVSGQQAGLYLEDFCFITGIKGSYKGFFTDLSLIKPFDSFSDYYLQIGIGYQFNSIF